MNKDERVSTRTSRLPEGTREVSHPDADAVSCSYELRGAFYGALFVGTSVKPRFHYRFGSAQDRDAYIERQLAPLRRRFAAHIEARRTAIAFVHQVRVGDIFYTSWGYEQTNVDFYQVVQLHGDKTVALRELEQEQQATSSHSMVGYAVPRVGVFVAGAELFTRRPTPKGIKVKPGRYAVPWDRTPKRFSTYG